MAFAVERKVVCVTSAGVAALVGNAKAIDDHTAPLLHIFGTHSSVDVGLRREGDRRIGTADGDNS